jgi:hypothetical protein
MTDAVEMQRQMGGPYVYPAIGSGVVGVSVKEEPPGEWRATSIVGCDSFIPGSTL